MAYRIAFKSSAKRELARLPRQHQRRVVKAIEGLATTPRPPGVEKLTNADGAYRIRVGAYRVVYQIEDRKLIVYIIKIGDRKEVYRKR